jgi:hypothetical protein
MYKLQWQLKYIDEQLRSEVKLSYDEENEKTSHSWIKYEMIGLLQVN